MSRDVKFSGCILMSYQEGSWQYCSFCLNKSWNDKPASVTEHSFIFSSHLIGEKSNQSHSKGGITGKQLNKALRRNFLIFHPEISLHFAVALREAYDALKDTEWSSDWPDLLHNIVKGPSKYKRELFPFVCKSKYNWPFNALLQTVTSVNFASAEIAFRLPKKLCLNLENEMRLWSLTFFTLFVNEVLLKSLGLLIYPQL